MKKPHAIKKHWLFGENISQLIFLLFQKYGMEKKSCFFFLYFNFLQQFDLNTSFSSILLPVLNFYQQIIHQKRLNSEKILLEKFPLRRTNNQTFVWYNAFSLFIRSHHSIFSQYEVPFCSVCYLPFLRRPSAFSLILSTLSELYLACLLVTSICLFCLSSSFVIAFA